MHIAEAARCAPNIYSAIGFIFSGGDNAFSREAIFFHWYDSIKNHQRADAEKSDAIHNIEIFSRS
ncbi:MAG: hypothetical protein HHJ09_03450 [Glaciimonas sp.]|nr:hypothetical protein [Glaciimonas sp.]